jgi:hypothetical protein
LALEEFRPDFWLDRECLPVDLDLLDGFLFLWGVFGGAPQAQHQAYCQSGEHGTRRVGLAGGPKEQACGREFSHESGRDGVEGGFGDADVVPYCSRCLL